MFHGGHTHNNRFINKQLAFIMVDREIIVFNKLSRTHKDQLTRIKIFLDDGQ